MSRNKVYDSFERAVADIPDGATIMIGGFGGASGQPENLILALRQHGARDLTIIGNTAGTTGTFGARPGHSYIDATILIENGQVRKAICSFPFGASPSRPTAFETQYLAGKVKLELVPQGTLAERIRAGGAGIGGFYTPTGAGTIIERGKEKRVLDGREMILEWPLRADFALLRAYKADKMGNLVYRGVSRSFNPVMAPAASVTIVEVDEIVEPGQLHPEAMVTPGIFVDRIVKRPKGSLWVQSTKAVSVQ